VGIHGQWERHYGHSWFYALIPANAAAVDTIGDKIIPRYRRRLENAMSILKADLELPKSPIQKFASRGSILRRWCMNRLTAVLGWWLFALFDSNGSRHTEAGHPAQDVASDLRLGLLIGQSPGVEAATEDRFVSGHGGLHPAPPRIS